MAFPHRVDPRIRAYGKARIDITRRASDEDEWQRQWKDPRYPFPFTWTGSWKQSIEYRVDDFAAEVGFMMDVLGFPAQAFSPSFATFTSPGLDFSFSVAAASRGFLSTPPDAFRLQFMIADIEQTVAELERRGVVFEKRPDPKSASPNRLISGCFRTPHGICIDLLGYADRSDSPPPASPPAATRPAPPTEAVVFAQEPLVEPDNEPEPEELPLFASDLDILAEHARSVLEVDEQADPHQEDASPEDVSPADFGLDDSRPAATHDEPPPTTPAASRLGTELAAPPSRPDPFRGGDQGRFPSVSPRLRSSSHPRPVRPGNKDRPGNGGMLGASLRPAPSDRRELPRPPVSRPELPKSPPDPPSNETTDEPEPEEELKYEDLDTDEDYDAPY